MTASSDTELYYDPFDTEIDEDLQANHQVVREGSVMLLLNGSTNRDQREFADADRFSIYRRASHHVGFGYGIHFRLGAALARLERSVALGRADQAHMQTVRGPESLPVIVGQADNVRLSTKRCEFSSR
jgi:cytochrome P450